VAIRVVSRDGATVSSRTVRLAADTTSRVDLGTGAQGRQVVVSAADRDVVVAAATFETAGRQPQLSVLALN
jgi:hypothetical protein